ncbi:MAG: CPBP family intramembrane metalloprotease [Bacteroidia bacterium]|nr:CPBP family intramembrane metalloprotease [Bacteroidia bacterium]
MSRQLITYFSLAYLISWITWWPLYAQALGFSSYTPLKYQHALGAFGPMIAAFILSYKFRGFKGSAYLFLNSIVPTGLSYLLIALMSPFFLLVMAGFIHYFQTGIFPNLAKTGLNNEFPGTGLISLFFYNLLFFGFGEEIGWRGFALPRLQKHYNALISGIILTVFWALWHWPLFLYRPGYLSMDLAALIGWLLSLLTGSILLTWLFNSSRGSILVCAVFHSTIDIVFTSDQLDKNLVGLMGMLITIWGLAVVFIYKPKNLSRLEKTTSLEDSSF